jgi:hypothetical protein
MSTQQTCLDMGFEEILGGARVFLGRYFPTGIPPAVWNFVLNLISMAAERDVLVTMLTDLNLKHVCPAGIVMMNQPLVRPSDGFPTLVTIPASERRKVESVDDCLVLIKQLITNGCRIEDSVRQMMFHSKFFNANESGSGDVELVAVTPGDLRVTSALLSRQEFISLAERRFGLRLCQPMDGLLARQAYREQPVSTKFEIVMPPIRGQVFCLLNHPDTEDLVDPEHPEYDCPAYSGSGIVLSSDFADDDDSVDFKRHYVFRRG